MKCTNCNIEFGDIITICPYCFSELGEEVQKTTGDTSKSTAFSRGAISIISDSTLEFLQIREQPKIAEIATEITTTLPEYKEEKPPQESPKPLKLSSAQQLAQECLERGKEKEAKGQFSEALIEYLEAIKYNPKWKEPYLKGGELLLKTGDYNQAYKVFIDLISKAGKDADAYYYLGRISSDYKKLYDDARQFYKLALNYKPDHIKAKEALENLEKILLDKAAITKPSLSTIRCPYCNGQIPAGSKFCGKCGRKLL